MQMKIPKRGQLNQIYIDEDKTKLGKLICVWCGDIFMQPQRLYCGHTACLRCVERSLQSQKRSQKSIKCMICGEIVDESEIGEDRIGKSMIQAIKVRCSSANCKWQGSNSAFLQHYDHECEHNERTGDSRYEFTYFSNKAEFVCKLNDEEQKRQHKPNMLHPAIGHTLREKMEKEWDAQQRFNDEEWMRKTKRFRKTFGL